MEPRTGKTKVCIDWASILHQRGKASRVLIVCPVSVMEVWVDEIAIHCPVNYRITMWDKRGRKRFELPRYGGSQLDFVIMNFDALSTPGAKIIKGGIDTGRRSKSRGGRYTVKKKIIAWNPHLIVLDESHRIKSTSAMKSRALHSIGPHADYRIIATGTAVTKAKRVFDLFSQWKFLNPQSPLIAGMNLAEFKGEYGRFLERNGFSQFIGVKNEPKLRKKLHKEAFAVARDECFDLPANFPPKIIKVPLEETAKIYDDMAEEMVARIESGEYTEASIKLVQNLRFAQITSGLAKTSPTLEHPEGRWVRVGKEKLRYLDDLMQDWMEQDEKVVICARFRADIASIAKMIEGYSSKPKVFLLQGGMKPAERQAAIKGFRECDTAAAFIMNPQAGSLGIDLRTASTMVWYSLVNSFVDYSQSLDRIALSGKANRFYYLLGEGTYDELMFEALQTDGDIVKMIQASPHRLLRNFRP